MGKFNNNGETLCKCKEGYNWCGPVVGRGLNLQGINLNLNQETQTALLHRIKLNTLVLPLTTVARRPLPACGGVGITADHDTIYHHTPAVLFRERPDTDI